MTTRFVLLTVARLANGYRLIAATPCCAERYIWLLWRGHRLIAWLNTRSVDNVVAVDLVGPIAPGEYRISVDCFTSLRTNSHQDRSARAFSAQVWTPR